MHLHLARVRRGAATYVYGQLVESVRRADGMPTQRLVASLGQLSEADIHNFRTALEASRRGKRVFLDRRSLPAATQFAKPTQNLRYLDAAVLLDVWRGLGFDALLRSLTPHAETTVAFWDVIAALTLQRGIDPGSKLFAERWFPRTALPELLGIAPPTFNNTRIHRVLDDLDRVTPALMQRLPRLYQERHGAFAALFLDVTDVRFVGEGPELAEKAKTKEGIVDRKVGIVLLCNQDGYPLRWQVIPGKRPDATAMHSVFEDIRGLDWLGETPVVCDRAMGCSADLERLLRTKTRFVTALRSNEFAAYTDAIPHQPLADLEPAAAPPPEGEDPCAIEAASRVEKAGMQRVSPTLYVLDGGLVQRDVPRMAPSTREGHDHAARALTAARQIRTLVEQGLVDSFNSAARQIGVGIQAAKGYRRLLALSEGIQLRILEGEAARVSLSRLYGLAGIADSEGQERTFERLRSTAKPAAPAQRVPQLSGTPPQEEPAEEQEQKQVQVRAVVAFNPELFVDHRRTAQRQLQEVQAYVRDLNTQLAAPRSRRTARDVEMNIDRMLRRRDLLDVFRVHVRPTMVDGRERPQARVELAIEQWRRRRRVDGFSVIVAHPAVPHTAAQLCQLYRAKDAVEKDFRTIKSVVQLRPVFHHTDVKVRAHVTLCMLALALERELSRRLKRSSAERALETLAACCLNRFQDSDGESHYVVTHPDGDQRTLLRQLKLEHLADDSYVVDHVRPR
jgi:hypothetical protein